MVQEADSALLLTISAQVILAQAILAETILAQGILAQGILAQGGLYFLLSRSRGFDGDGCDGKVDGDDGEALLIVYGCSDECGDGWCHGSADGDGRQG